MLFLYVSDKPKFVLLLLQSLRLRVNDLPCCANYLLPLHQDSSHVTLHLSTSFTTANYLFVRQLLKYLCTVVLQINHKLRTARICSSAVAVQGFDRAVPTRLLQQGKCSLPG